MECKNSIVLTIQKVNKGLFNFVLQNNVLYINQKNNILVVQINRIGADIKKYIDKFRKRSIIKLPDIEIEFHITKQEKAFVKWRAGRHSCKEIKSIFILWNSCNSLKNMEVKLYGQKR